MLTRSPHNKKKTTRYRVLYRDKTFDFCFIIIFILIFIPRSWLVCIYQIFLTHTNYVCIHVYMSKHTHTWQISQPQCFSFFSIYIHTCKYIFVVQILSFGRVAKMYHRASLAENKQSLRRRRRSSDNVLEFYFFIAANARENCG